YGHWLISLSIVFGFIMAFGIGANDVANALGTSVGSKAISIKQAIVIAVIFEFAGAYLAGGEVTRTIRKGIIDQQAFVNSPEILVFGMIASLLASGLWLILASRLGWPVSTTHSIIGAIIGFAVVGASADAVEWGKVIGIIGSWIITPGIAAMIAYTLFVSSQKLIFNAANPLDAAKKYIPYYMGLAGFIMSLVTVKKGLKHLGLNLSSSESYLICGGIAFSIFLLGSTLIKRQNIHHRFKQSREQQYENIEQVFAILMVTTACCMAFAHGSNDVANAIGPLAAVVSTIQNQSIAATTTLAWWILPLGGAGIVLGLATYGKKVIATIGQGITHLTPSRGFAAELAAASTVIIASGTGLPISTTQTLVGAVLGVGLARGIAALNLNMIRTIVVSWVVTLPAGALISIMIFSALQAIFTI
ncbi:MAG: inorganic phosphate transporter, partial [Shewanellaceae bacterium]|nr:inorganic phosphate transporter [Shewanellaceae bacterium]